MYISCNKLKQHIKNNSDIDMLHIWDKFTIRCAEIEGVEDKGAMLKDVVTVEIVKCEQHPTKERYHVLEVSDGTTIYHILCAAPNVHQNMKCFLVKVGGMVSGITIAEKKIAGVVSEGMLCAGDELGINDDHDGIIELPNNTPLGKDIKELWPFVDDIVVEIDNKSLTNRPDLWGHYGIAREICAITNHELIPLPIENINNNSKDLDIKINNNELCKRYCGIKIGNIENNKTPLEMQVFLKYAGMRSISLMVDLTNYLMLELGQPMHAFDARYVENIEVDNASDGEEFITLDGVVRKLTKENLLIKNGNKNFAIAGVMGGLDSEIKSDTNSLVLESACFDSTSIRKTATSLGMRTEASARYEKSLDPEICPIAIKRFIYLLKEQNPDIEILSNLTDIYPNPTQPKYVTLSKQKLNTYMGMNMDEKLVKNILESLEFKVETTSTSYNVLVPSFRATKDISLDADLIEEVARIYGYENITPVPLRLDLTFKVHEHTYEEEYLVKNFLTNRYSASEVHSYLWYDQSFLKENDINKKNTIVVNKADNNILRDNLSLSLLPFATKNFKTYDNFIIYEIGTIIKGDDNLRDLSIIIGGSKDALEVNYNKAKLIVTELFKQNKNQNVTFKSCKTESYNDQALAKEIIVNNKVVGNLNVVNAKVTNNIAKKKSIITIEISFEEYQAVKFNDIILKELNKYQETTLDYTISLPENMKYEDLEKVITNFNNKYIIDYKLFDKYNNKYTIRFTATAPEHDLTSKNIEAIQESFIKHLNEYGLQIER
jgi:phenylalanyl-tRNA synthetase beta chain